MKPAALIPFLFLTLAAFASQPVKQATQLMQRAPVPPPQFKTNSVGYVFEWTGKTNFFTGLPQYARIVPPINTSTAPRPTTFLLSASVGCQAQQSPDLKNWKAFGGIITTNPISVTNNFAVTFFRARAVEAVTCDPLTNPWEIDWGTNSQAYTRSHDVDDTNGIVLPSFPGTNYAAARSWAMAGTNKVFSLFCPEITWIGPPAPVLYIIQPPSTNAP